LNFNEDVPFWAEDVEYHGSAVYPHRFIRRQKLLIAASKGLQYALTVSCKDAHPRVRHAGKFRNPNKEPQNGKQAACLGSKGCWAWPSNRAQSMVSTSSTEAEFIAAVQAVKIAKYLRSILLELVYVQPGPT
jgi:hypothetical protein